MKKLILFNVVLLFAGLKIFAQSHLKNVQATSVWAPANVKIDGKINEWEDNFQAYNKSTRLFYTLANNEKYLYLAITSTDAQNNTKIAAGGITLTINTAGKKKDKDAFMLTYPVISSTGRGRGRGGRRQASSGDDTAATNAAHKQFIESSKEIKVFGFKDVDDTLISIYNEYGIKTAIGYDSLGNYNYELAIPLKLLGLSPDNTGEIAYNVKVNGMQIGGGIQGKAMLDGIQGGGVSISGVGGGGFGGGGGGRGGGRGGGGGGGKASNDVDFQDLTSPTDFWGKYTLAKK
jgi:hypothetical protein